MRCEVCGAPVESGQSARKCRRCETLGVKSGSGPLSTVGRPASTPTTNSPAGATVTITTGYQRVRPSVQSVPSGTLRSDTSYRMTDPAFAEDNLGDKKNIRPSLPLPPQAATSTIQPSQVVLDGKYRLIDELGRGSMGTVFLAEDISLKRKVAIKFLLPELADSAECAIRFKREAIAMAAIRNENVAQIHAFGEDKGNPYFVMEYINGETMEFLIDSYNRRGFFIPVADAVDMMIQVLSGVTAIHRADAVHRDIKPGNIMLADDAARAVIMDFGLVRDVKVEDDMRTLAGTPAYIAPELVEGKAGAETSKLADIYSLGATFYELITGSIPFRGESWVNILQKHIAEVPVFPSSRRRGIPEALDDIIMRAMAKDPKDRYASCEDMLDHVLDLAGVTEGHQKRSPSEVPPPVARRRSSGNPRRSPRQHGTTGDSSSGKYRSSPTFTRGKLLVADDNRQFRAQVYESIKQAVPSCRIHSATDGVMALDMLKSIRPHVLLVNLALPEMNGFELIATAAGDPDLANIEFVVVSENSGTKDAQLLRALGVTHFWNKPVDTEAMLEVLCPLLEQPKFQGGGPPGTAY